MATINPVVLPLKVLKDGTNRLRIAVRHRQQTSYIVTNIRLDNEKQLKNGKIVRRPDAAELNKLAKELQKKMHKAAAELNFEAAAELRDKLIELKKMLNDME